MTRAVMRKHMALSQMRAGRALPDSHVVQRFVGLSASMDHRDQRAFLAREGGESA
jgi:hypothetical protein